MKTLEELAKMTTSDIANILPKIIIEEVEEAARARRFGRSLVRINTDLVGKPGRSIHIPKRGVMTAAIVSEGTELNAFTGGTSPSYTTVEIVPKKAVSYAAITQESIDATEFDLVRDHIREAGEALADLEDTEILKALMGVEEVDITLTNMSANTWTNLTRAPIAWITKKQGPGNLTAVDYLDGYVKVSAGGDYTFTVWARKTTGVESQVEYIDPGTFGQFNYGDIVTAVTKIRARKFNPNFFVVNPLKMTQLLQDSKFIDTSAYGSSEPILTGEIGKIGGCKVLSTTQMPESAVLFLDSTRAGYLAIKRNIDLKRWDSPRTDSVELYFYFEFGARVVNPEAVEVLVDVGDLAANKTP